MQITFRGIVIGDNSAGLIGYKFVPSEFASAVIDIKAPLGIGYWSKPDGVETISHTLDLEYKVSSVATVTTILKSLGSSRGTLTVPGYETRTNCRYVGSRELEISGSDNNTLIIQTSLTFLEYPVL